MKIIASLNQVVPRIPELQFAEPINWEIRQGEQWAIVGPNGSGKTLLVDMLLRRYALKSGTLYFDSNSKPSEMIKSIAFKDIYSLADCRESYYQQRWHSTETDEMPLVEDLLKEHVNSPYLHNLLTLFKVQELLPKKIIFLSSGELRKFLIIRTLLLRPRVLVLDNPFIGLDSLSRELLVEMLEQMTTLEGITIVLLLPNPIDIPQMVTHVLPIKAKKLFLPVKRADFTTEQEELLFAVEETRQELPGSCTPPGQHTLTFRMEKVSIRYGQRTILKELDWEVRNGEKWSLSGPNGSGKSTLLSLVYADNPQSYANNITLFDKKRGTGESIWDIKKRIGYVSPEIHLYYRENVPAWKIVGSGFFDSIGLYRTCNDEQKTVALQWMKVFGILHLQDRLFMTLSSGEQRLLLLARAFVKDPELLILDEPLHGLDKTNKQKVAGLITAFCERPGKTLIYVTHYPHELPDCVNMRFELIKNT